MLPTAAIRCVAAVAMALAVGGCAGDAGYPEAVQRNFIRSCEAGGGNAKGCACALDQIQEKFSYEDFKKEETAISSGRAPSREITDAIAECV